MRDRSRKSGLRLLLRDFGSGHAAILTPNGSQLGTRPSAAQRSTNRHVICTVFEPTPVQRQRIRRFLTRSFNRVDGL
jgi:hypothetical protein